MKFDHVKRLPLFLFSAYFTKILLFSHPSWVDGGILLVLGAAAGFYEAWEQLKLMKNLQEEVRQLAAKHSELEKGNQDLKTYVTGLKLGQQMRIGGR